MHFHSTNSVQHRHVILTTLLLSLLSSLYRNNVKEGKAVKGGLQKTYNMEILEEVLSFIHGFIHGSLLY